LSITKQLFIQNIKLNIGKHAFAIPASTIWNQLFITLKSSETIANVRKQTLNIIV